MQLLHSATRNYSWGSRTLIPHLQGQPDSEKPVAELWFGAHPGDPSTVDDRLLNEVIAEDPAGQLGSRVSAEYGERLPFLLKVLAIGAPLSLQVHPDLAQAAAGFAAEEAAGEWVELDKWVTWLRHTYGLPVLVTNCSNNYGPYHFPEKLIPLVIHNALAGKPLHNHG